jgi:hypothetical protein
LTTRSVISESQVRIDLADTSQLARRAQVVKPSRRSEKATLTLPARSALRRLTSTAAGVTPIT